MYKEIQAYVYELMALVESKTGLRAYPANYQGSINGESHIRFYIIGPRVKRLNSSKGKLYEGVLKVSLLVPAGAGDKLAFSLGADVASVFNNKTFDNELSFSVGSLNTYGLDSVLKSHWRVDYTNNFLISGE